ncbi:anaerobic glycerol-3-phosphate dehydrogenase subunit C [Halanaeroarchaeum sulfurireducens]|uniref:Anaerobic glycerol-3-phosphate dehydrogenase subunit C n=1 Tax=Halanaeroarchaeum sulfurireducens TaxID=1604004 RepID=A0A0F7PCU9_9EURY|nr:anaerobic glycerol-3-phosphate dehydrogenase subunit C [Halanaeroarchaeum sulfurireducens]AKH97995.1 anaerobic glycerol-3-phosphate dehydrogenase subunit C [Halanaeroarchaeum sulfurireducens]ALG82389.1 anaerobic glycerol-3-phosphate dehydrogenase subunit C [Halanaeroarchaeum sulfurireducens]
MSDDRDRTLSLRVETDACYQCATCDTVCPIAPVEDSFPGPKFEGPEQWRLRGEDTPIDPSIEACSNCLQCEAACPEGVSLGRLLNETRAEHVRERSSFSAKHVRDRLLANYGRLAAVASRVPRLTNALANSPVVRAIAERTLGIVSTREAPAFATETFREWWNERGGARISDPEQRVAYFHGDYANYHTPAVGRALVEVYEHFGYEVAVPEQRCSGTPMFANGFLDDAERVASFNVDRLAPLVADGYDVVASCTSCSYAIRSEYPDLFDMEGVETVSENTYDALEYLRANESLEAALAGASLDLGTLAYHAPCHARNQGLAQQTPDTFDRVANVDVVDVGDSCSGMSGTYGWKEERYETSMTVGQEMFDGIETVDADTAVTECPTCAMQMEHGSGVTVSHPLELLCEALDV